ncbi:MAG: endonuclease/exonuclease/phosphatase family protein [Candidatus Izemoplasmatales bacterium]
MKRILKILITLVIVVIVFVVGFIITLQAFEFRPEAITTLTITDNPEDLSENYVDSAVSLTILTFNIGYASLSETEDFVMDGGEKAKMDTETEVIANLDGISSILEDNPADIYLLQEVDIDSKRSYNINQLDYYHDILGKSSVLAYNYRCIFVPFPFDLNQMMGKVNSGIVTFSDYYTESAERHQLPGSFDWPVSLANLKRAMLISKYPIQNSEKYLVVINVHLSAYDDGTMRLQEMEALKQVMQDEYEAGNYVLVGGDFNQTFPAAYSIDGEAINYYYELKNENFWQAYPMEEDWLIGDSFSFGVDVTTPTCRLLHQPYDTINLENNQYYVIDGFIVSNNLTIDDITTLDENFVYSDHNPVKITVSFNG